MTSGKRKPIVDSHVHFWNLRDPDAGMRWTWLGADVDHPILGDVDGMKSVKFDINHLFAEARFADVRAFVHVQAAIGSDDPVMETRWLTRMREDAPAPFTIVAHVDLNSSDSARQLDGHSESPYFVGVRDFAIEPMLAQHASTAELESALRTLSDRGLVLDLDCEWPNMPAAVDLARRHPNLQIVLEHFGYPRTRTDDYFVAWREAIAELAGAENVICKISGAGMTDPRFTSESLSRWIETCLDHFGPERCMLGSNWPVDRLYSSYDAIMNLYRDFVSRLSDDEETAILSGNAARIFRLPTPPDEYSRL